MVDDATYMRLALEQAAQARSLGEVPVGAVVVGPGGDVLGRGFNQPIGTADPTAHAEIVALRLAAAGLGNYRLTGATVYSTVEPCLMCLGAMLHARVARLVYGAADPKLGWTSRLETLGQQDTGFNHRLDTTGGVLADESRRLLTEFFGERRGVAVPLAHGCGEVPKWS